MLRLRAGNGQQGVGHVHPGVSSEHGNEGCTADRRTRQYVLIAR